MSGLEMLRSSSRFFARSTGVRGTVAARRRAGRHDTACAKPLASWAGARDNRSRTDWVRSPRESRILVNHDGAIEVIHRRGEAQTLSGRMRRDANPCSPRIRNYAPPRPRTLQDPGEGARRRAAPQHVAAAGYYSRLPDCPVLIPGTLTATYATKVGPFVP